ncbi:MAG: cupin domain-containing protein [Steroidobacteraceae bacterium]
MNQLPMVDEYGEGFYSRMVEWGGMIVSNETFPKGLDATPLFKGLPQDMCQSPHWGKILRGQVRIKTASGEFVLKTGDVYYLEPGHVPVYEEDTEVLEFSPKKEYQMTIDVVNRNIADS